jgi:hypothetical protein
MATKIAVIYYRAACISLFVKSFGWKVAGLTAFFLKNWRGTTFYQVDNNKLLGIKTFQVLETWKV